MRAERVSFGALPPIRRQGSAIRWCENCGRRYLGQNCPDCRPAKPITEPLPDEAPGGSPLAVGLWLAALMLAGLLFLAGLVFG